MKISYNWLRTYLALDRAPAEVAEMLTMAGLEVDGLEERRASLEGVVVGHVQRVDPHPNADRLTLCTVDVDGNEPLRIVCGAPNVAAGQRVPVAVLGAILQLPSRGEPGRREAVTIRRTKIRGEVSEGMICAEDELGLSNDHSGIMVLAPDAPVGEPLATYLEATGVDTGDAVLDVAVTPNRPDAVSHIGVARDLSALMQLPLLRPEVSLPKQGGDAAEHIKVEVFVPGGCPRYTAMVVRGVRVGESPAWLKQRLSSVGMRPRNNVVDVTNFVMYECGQPLHAFDYDLISEATIQVRFSEPGEQFTTLDGKKRSLPDETLLICDGSRPVALAGIMGGENSEVTDGTTNVLLESAYFEPSLVRRTARALGLQTDASYRFERGVDADGQLWAAARAAELISEIAGGEVVTGVVDVRPIPLERRVVTLRNGSVGRVLGTDVPADEARRLLRAIGFDVELRSDRSLRCTVPTFRPDVEREIDVIEEVARLHGFGEIPEPVGMRVPANVIPRERAVDAVRARVRGVLQGGGYREVYTNSLLSAETAARFLAPDLSFLPSGDVVPTLNPISQEMAVLRPSLLPGMLDVLRHNLNRGARRLRLFELGHVFRGGVDAPTLVRGYLEEEALLFLAAGLRQQTAWYANEEPTDFFDLKGTLEELLEALDLPDVRLESVYQATALTEFHVVVHGGDTLLGVAGKVSRAELERFDVDEDVYFAELGLGRFTGLSGATTPEQFRGVSRFPVVERDIALVVDEAQEVGPILTTIGRAAGTLLHSARPFDLYSGAGIPEGRKSVAFGLVFGGDRTLTDEEVDARVGEVVNAVRKEFSADLRG